MAIFQYYDRYKHLMVRLAQAIKVENAGVREKLIP
jgi:hypothetical protein